VKIACDVVDRTDLVSDRTQRYYVVIKCWVFILNENTAFLSCFSVHTNVL